MNKNDYYARRMHTPDDPARGRLRENLRHLSRALIPLHRALIAAARSDYDFAFGTALTPNELLRLLPEDPFFAWLRPMTSLIVDIDEMVRIDFDQSDVAQILSRTEQFFGAAADPAFAGQYVPILQRDTEVAMAHAAVRRALAALREDVPPDKPAENPADKP
jgi:hypothetical protein